MYNFPTRQGPNTWHASCLVQESKTHDSTERGGGAVREFSKFNAILTRMMRRNNKPRKFYIMMVKYLAHDFPSGDLLQWIKYENTPHFPLSQVIALLNVLFSERIVQPIIHNREDFYQLKLTPEN